MFSPLISLCLICQKWNGMFQGIIKWNCLKGFCLLGWRWLRETILKWPESLQSVTCGIFDWCAFWWDIKINAVVQKIISNWMKRRNLESWLHLTFLAHLCFRRQYWIEEVYKSLQNCKWFGFSEWLFLVSINSWVNLSPWLLFYFQIRKIEILLTIVKH